MSDKYKFDIKEVEILGPTINRQGSGIPMQPRVGVFNGKGLSSPHLYRVTVRHIPTGLSVTEDRFPMVHRNKEKALKQLEKLVNDFIADLLEAEAKAKDG